MIALSNNQPSSTTDVFNQLINIPLGFEEGKPTRNLTRAMYRNLYKEGVDAAEKVWRAADSAGAPDRPNNIVMKRIGYNFLAFDRHKEAVQAFELFVRVKPRNANAWDSLNPNNGGAATMLKRLKGGR